MAMVYRRFTIPDPTSEPATVATLATIQAEGGPSVAGPKLTTEEGWVSSAADVDGGLNGWKFPVPAWRHLRHFERNEGRLHVFEKRAEVAEYGANVPRE